MERWLGRVAVVTGASAGIGHSIAEELVKKGMKVVGLARRVDRVEELEKKLSSESGKLYPRKCDITKEEEVKAAFQWVKSNLGGVDVLVNNAGTAKFNSLITGPTGNWKNILDLNVMALSTCTTEALQIMKEKGVDDGHIFNINSVAGHYIPTVDRMNMAMYSASKHAVVVLTEGLRRELVKEKSKIRVTSVSPGAVHTEFGKAMDMPASVYGGIDLDELFKIIPHLKGKDVADCVMFALAAPSHVQIHEIIVRPTGEGGSSDAVREKMQQLQAK